MFSPKYEYKLCIFEYVGFIGISIEVRSSLKEWPVEDRKIEHSCVNV